MTRPSPAEVAARYNALALSEGWHSICSPASRFERAELDDVMAIWRAHARGRAIPSRRALTPQAMRSHLADIAIYERIGAEGKTRRYRVRVMGARFSSVLGNLNGRYFDEAVPPAHLKRWRAAPDAALEALAPLRFVSRTETAGKDFITGEYLLAPMLGDGGRADCVLAAGAFGPTVMAQRPGGVTAA